MLKIIRIEIFIIYLMVLCGLIHAITRSQGYSGNDFPCYMQNAGHTGFCDGSGIRSVPQIKWQVQGISTQETGDPVHRNDTLFVPCGNKILGFNGLTGEKILEVSSSVKELSIWKGKLYGISGESDGDLGIGNKIIALDIESKSIAWEKTTPGYFSKYASSVVAWDFMAAGDL